MSDEGASATGLKWGFIPCVRVKSEDILGAMTPLAWNEQDALEQLARVLSSSGFVRNERMSRFLRFLVERRLQGRDDELKESVIAVEVFHRKPDYDPKQDSVVRTEAGRLRARLAEYYTGADGRHISTILTALSSELIDSTTIRAINTGADRCLPTTDTRHEDLTGVA